VEVCIVVPYSTIVDQEERLQTEHKPRQEAAILCDDGPRHLSLPNTDNSTVPSFVPP
jgi:hypothetical protein